MIDNRGCYSLEQLNSCSFMKNDNVELEEIINSEIKLKDKFWFVCKKVLTKEQNKQLAISVAETVLDIYESKYPENKAPRLAIDAAKLYLLGKISLLELKKKRATAAAAVADADATAASYAAATAASYAATAASYADATAASYADAAATTATYAATAADAAKYNNNLLNALKSFIK